MNMKRTRTLPAGRRAARGMTLIEVLIAVLILSFGMLGIAALQVTALRSSQSTINRNEAVAQSYAILDAMRANRKHALLGDYNLGAYDAANAANTSWTCAAPELDGTLARSDLREWMTRLQSPQGLGPTACAIIASVPGVQDGYQVRLRWDDSRGNVGANAQPNDQITVTASRL